MPSDNDTVFDKLRKAYNENRGTHLTAEEVNRLMSSSEIYEAVMDSESEE